MDCETMLCSCSFLSKVWRSCTHIDRIAHGRRRARRIRKTRTKEKGAHSSTMKCSVCSLAGLSPALGASLAGWVARTAKVIHLLIQDQSPIPSDSQPVRLASMPNDDLVAIAEQRSRVNPSRLGPAPRLLTIRGVSAVSLIPPCIFQHRHVPDPPLLAVPNSRVVNLSRLPDSSTAELPPCLKIRPLC